MTLGMAGLAQQTRPQMQATRPQAASGAGMVQASPRPIQQAAAGMAQPGGIHVADNTTNPNGFNYTGPGSSPTGGGASPADFGSAQPTKVAPQTSTPGAVFGTSTPGQLSSGNGGVQYGGVLGQANATANYYGQQAAAAQNAAAPTVDLSGANAYGGMAGAGLGLMQQTAMGGGAAQQAAAAQNAQGTSSAINAGMALANSSRGGGPAQAAAQAGAQQGAGAAIQTGAMNAAQTQASMAAQAQGQYESAAQSEQQQQYAQQMGIAGLQQAQSAQNAQIAQGYYGMGNQVEGQQLGADSGVYANNLGLQGQGMAAAAQQNSANISAGVGAGTAALGMAAALAA